MSETIAVLFIFFILIVFGIVFYYKYSEVSFEQKQEELMGRRAMETTLKTLFLPELICSRGEAEPESNCIDLMKLNTAKKVFKTYFSEYYFDLFPYTKITINQTYPTEENWILYDKPKPNWTKIEQTFFVVSLKNQIKEKEQTGEFSFGYITVGSYS